MIGAWLIPITRQMLHIMVASLCELRHDIILTLMSCACVYNYLYGKKHQNHRYSPQSLHGETHDHLICIYGHQ